MDPELSSLTAWAKALTANEVGHSILELRNEYADLRKKRRSQIGSKMGKEWKRFLPCSGLIDSSLLTVQMVSDRSEAIAVDPNRVRGPVVRMIVRAGQEVFEHSWEAALRGNLSVAYALSRLRAELIDKTIATSTTNEIADLYLSDKLTWASAASIASKNWLGSGYAIRAALGNDDAIRQLHSDAHAGPGLGWRYWKTNRELTKVSITGTYEVRWADIFRIGADVLIWSEMSLAALERTCGFPIEDNRREIYGCARAIMQVTSDEFVKSIKAYQLLEHSQIVG